MYALLFCLSIYLSIYPIHIYGLSVPHEYLFILRVLTKSNSFSSLMITIRVLLVRRREVLLFPFYGEKTELK